MKINEVKQIRATVSESIGNKSIAWTTTGGWIVVDAIDPNIVTYTAPAVTGVYTITATLINFPKEKATIEVTVGDGSNSYWRQVDKEIWWQHEINSDLQSGDRSPWEKISDLPFNQDFVVIRNGYNTMYYHIYGSEFNYTCTDSMNHFPGRHITNFSWDPLPAIMLAEVLYPIAAETKGDGGNMMLISEPYNFPGNTNDWLLRAYRNGGKTTSQIKIPKPYNLNNPNKMAVKVNIASTFAAIDYIYIYQWITE